MAEKIPLNNFQTIADANGIEIVNFRLPNVGSMSTESEWPLRYWPGHFQANDPG